MNIFRSHSEKETIALAKKLARRLKGGDVVLLEGELGSGKTTFVRALAAAFGIRERITSPTFVLLHVHGVKRRAWSVERRGTKRYTLNAVRYFIHTDAYRVKSASELKEAGLADWLGRPDTIVVVEWGEKIKSLLRGQDYLQIKFRHGRKANERKILSNFNSPNF